MNQRFRAQNIKIYHKKKMPLCQIFLLPEKKSPASKHQILGDIFILVSSKNWQSGIFNYFYDIFKYFGPKNFGSLN